MQHETQLGVGVLKQQPVHFSLHCKAEENRQSSVQWIKGYFATCDSCHISSHDVRVCSLCKAICEVCDTADVHEIERQWPDLLIIPSYLECCTPISSELLEQLG